MNRKKIYFVQPNYLYGNAAHLPYASGTIMANAWKNELIRSSFSAEKIFFLRRDIDESIAEMDEPFMVGFSTYVWNFEYNKAFAKRLKEKHPACIVVFGGHHVPHDNSLLKDCEYIDILSHGEGEEVFEKLLLSYVKSEGLASVNNISYRDGERLITNSFISVSGTDYPSPYAEGCFDKLFEEYPELDFIGMLETNRGCPFSCSFCDWGNTKQGIRQFPLERVYNDIDWFAQKGIVGIGGADSNFGIFERDEAIVDYLIKISERSGLSQKFQVSYIKDDSDRMFSIAKKLHESGMSKGVTVSYQTVSDIAAANVGRKNLELNAYKKLLQRYNNLGIPTYTELILGLPGETYESFVKGIDSLLKAGQHFSLYVHNCEWLPCSAMGDKAYMEKHGIELSVIPLNQPHIQKPKGHNIGEFSRIVTRTNTMSQMDWLDMNLFSFTVQCFHHLGLLQFFALYLYHEQGVAYGEFYTSLLDFILQSPGTLCYEVFGKIKNSLQKVLSSDGSLVISDDIFGDVAWPFEEYAFLTIAHDAQRFYSEIEPFLKQFSIPQDLFYDLINYQKNILKLPGEKQATFNLAYDLHSFFLDLLKGKSGKIRKHKNTVQIDGNVGDISWPEYARYIVWYGRKDSRNIYTKEVCVYDR